MSDSSAGARAIETFLAVHGDATFARPEDRRALALCIDEAINVALTSAGIAREIALSRRTTERLDRLAHDLRNVLNAAMLSFDLLKNGRIDGTSKTGAMLGRSLVRMRDLIDRVQDAGESREPIVAGPALTSLDERNDRPEIAGTKEIVR